MLKTDSRNRWGGQAPDYRFSLANERTFLAWIRTSVAFLATVVVLDQIALHSIDSQPIRLLSIFFALIACIIAGTCYFKWRKNEIAMRHSEELPHDFLQPILCAAVFLSAITLTVLVIR